MNFDDTMPRRPLGLRWTILPTVLILFGAVVLWNTEDRERVARTLIIGQTDEPRSLDPHTTTSSNDFRICENLYEGLVRFAPGSLRIEPSLATAWEVSEDGTRYTFHLREGVRFHDGSSFDAEAVAFNFGRMLDPDHPYHFTGPFPLSFFFAPVERIEVVDDLTVTFYLNEPFAPFLANLAYPTGLIVSPAAVRRHRGDFRRQPSGTGPFQFERWESRLLVELSRFEDYHGDPAKTEAVVFRPIADAAARAAELLAGSVDLILEVPPDLLADLRTRPGFKVEEVAGTHLWFLILNCRHGPFSDPRLREAVNLAVNREAIVQQLLCGTATSADGILPRAFDWIYEKDPPEPLPFDPDRARALIEEAGAVGTRLRLLVPEGGTGMLRARAMAEAIQADLAAVGLQVRIEVFEWNTFLQRVNAGLGEDADMAAMAWMINDPDTLPFLTLRSGALPEHGGFNSGYFEDPVIDEWIEEARRTPNPRERAELYRWIEERARTQFPWLVVASEKLHAATGDEVRGVELHPAFLLRLAAVEKGGSSP